MTRSRIIVWIVATAFTTAAVAIGPGDPIFDLAWRTIDGGGQMSSTGGGFEVSGTIGQPDAGTVMTGGEFEVTGGFWFRVVPGDCNADGGVNLFDFADFIDCTSGPGGGLPEPDCACVDFDADEDVDLLDFGGLQVRITGP